jgi:hypothetical protein
LNVTYKVFAKILYGRLLPQAGFQSDKINNKPTLCTASNLKKCNEFNITTHHLFIDFKAAYDSIMRNEIYVGMSELMRPKNQKWCLQEKVHSRTKEEVVTKRKFYTNSLFFTSYSFGLECTTMNSIKSLTA